MSSTGDSNDVIDLSHSQSDKEHDPQPETPSGSKVCPLLLSQKLDNILKFGSILPKFLKKGVKLLHVLNVTIVKLLMLGLVQMELAL